jgi:hypothetical protein
VIELATQPSVSLAVGAGAGAGGLFALLAWRIVIRKAMTPAGIRAAQGRTEMLLGFVNGVLLLLLIFLPKRFFDRYYFQWYLSAVLFSLLFTLLPLTFHWRRSRGYRLLPLWLHQLWRRPPARAE